MALLPIIADEVHVEVGNRRLATSSRRGPIDRDGAAPEFRDVGKGKPLHVVIDHVYTGKYPKRGGLFGGSADVALVSGVKDYAVFSASTRALNLVSRGAKPQSHLQPNAFEDGTSLILYSPAVMSDSLTLTVEMAVDSFDRGLLDTISSGLQSAAGIPLMLPHAGYLLGAGQILKVAAGLADALFDGRPAFSITETLNFGLPGRPLAVADHWLLTHNTALTGLRYQPGKGLIGSDGQLYAGDDPYVVISVDGAERPELNNFTPTAASAAVLQKFFQMRDRTAASVEAFVEGLQLASDMKLRRQAEALKARVEGTTDVSARKRLQGELDAILKNITTEILRPA
ncbi:MAG TPA: hypothetical protein VM165_06420 [Planctomycetaceae bacterium]|nr:hypothetical protein [Planctomycetaceae bacterium]